MNVNVIKNPALYNVDLAQKIYKKQISEIICKLR